MPFVDDVLNAYFRGVPPPETWRVTVANGSKAVEVTPVRVGRADWKVVDGEAVVEVTLGPFPRDVQFDRTQLATSDGLLHEAAFPGPVRLAAGMLFTAEHRVPLTRADDG